MKGNINKNKKSSFLPGIAFLNLVLFLFSFPCFAQENTFKEMRKRYEWKDFSAVVRIYNNMRQSRLKEFRENKKEISVMTTRSLAEIIRSPEEITSTSIKIKTIFFELLSEEKYSDITLEDFHMPDSHKDIFVQAFREVYKQLFAKLIVTVNIPGVDILVDHEYKATTNKGYDPVELYLWMGPRRTTRYVKVTLKYDYTRFLESDDQTVLLEAGKEKRVTVKVKPKFIPPPDDKEPPQVKSPYITPKKTFFLVSIEQNYGKLSETFNEEEVQFIEPYRDFTAIEAGIGFSHAFHFSVKYGRNLNMFIPMPNDRWKGADINEESDYNLTNFEVNFVVNGVYKKKNPEAFIATFGYKNLKLEHVNFEGDTVTSTYHLFSNNYFYNTRSNKRNAFFAVIGGGYYVGGSQIQFYDFMSNIISVGFSTLGILASLELGGSFNGRFDFSIGGSYEILWSKILEDEAKSHNFPDDLKERITLFKVFTRLTFRF